MECVDFNDVSNKHFVAFSIKDLVENVVAQNIIDFIKETPFCTQLQCFHINVCYTFCSSLIALILHS